VFQIIPLPHFPQRGDLNFYFQSCQVMSKNRQYMASTLPLDHDNSNMTDNILSDRGCRTNQALPLRRDPVVKLCEWFGRLIGFQAPVGYEDETGLHFGMKPATNESSHSFDI
jgi:hypothetical protein